MSSQDERQQMTATVGYLESGQDRLCIIRPLFTYQQFLRSIIIVITPNQLITVPALWLFVKNFGHSGHSPMYYLYLWTLLYRAKPL